MDFKTVLNKSKDISIYHLNEFLGINKDLDVDTTASFEIEWSFEIEAREWGIKSLDISVTKVTGEITWEIDNEELTEEERMEVSGAGAFLYANNMWEGKLLILEGYSIVSNITVTGGCICPSDLELDFTKEEFTIE